MSDGHPYHPLVRELLEELEAEAGGPQLPKERLLPWAERLAALPELEPVQIQLTALIARFYEAGAVATVGQLAIIIALALGESLARAMLTKAGVASDQAQRLAKQAKGVSSRLAGGLAPPPSGVGLRKKR